MPSCLQFDRHAALRAFSRAWAKTGKRIAARIAMMATTTSSSINVKPRTRRWSDIALFLSLPGGETPAGPRRGGGLVVPFPGFPSGYSVFRASRRILQGAWAGCGPDPSFVVPRGRRHLGRTAQDACLGELKIRKKSQGTGFSSG